jgi:hypothetical protein
MFFKSVKLLSKSNSHHLTSIREAEISFTEKHHRFKSIVASKISADGHKHGAPFALDCSHDRFITLKDQPIRARKST